MYYLIWYASGNPLRAGPFGADDAAAGLPADGGRGADGGGRRGIPAEAERTRPDGLGSGKAPFGCVLENHAGRGRAAALPPEIAFGNAAGEGKPWGGKGQ